MSAGLAFYRALTALAGAVGGPLARWIAPGSEWNAVWRGRDEEAERAAGSIWVHAASLGEVGVARSWIEALLESGSRPPILLTVRTRTGLERARRELGDRIVARPAPIDVPRVIRERLDGVCPSRLDIIETELWPNLIYEARRCRVPVALVGATVSERTARRLQTLGLSGRDLFGAGVYVMAQSETHAGRFLALGVPRERVRVVGDLKAAAPVPHRASAFASRPALVFGSLRAGEEEVAVRAAQVLEEFRSEQAVASGTERVLPGDWEGRARALLVVAPRHAAGEARVQAALARAGFEVVARREATVGGDVGSWIDALSRKAGPRVGLLATHGELTAAYESAWAAVVGGTFVDVGGHNAWEPAARGAPILVGPHHQEILTAVEGIVRSGGGVISTDTAGHFESILRSWLRDADLEARGAAASRGAAAAAGAVARSLEAIESWRIVP